MSKAQHEKSGTSEAVGATDGAAESDDSPTDAEYIRERASTELVNQEHVDNYDIDIGRHHRGQSHLLSVDEPGAPGCLGNPHPVAEHGECDICETTHTRKESVEQFREDFRDRLRSDPAFREWVESLQGQRLVCYCVPELCHGDVILEFIDKGETALLRWENQQLRERVDELEDTVEKLTRSTGPALARLINGVNEQNGEDSGDAPGTFDPELIAAAAEATGVVQARGERLNDVEDTVQRHETEIENGQAIASDSQGEHWANVVAQAEKCRDMRDHQLPDNWVILYTDDVAKAIDPGKRRASQLIDEWTDTSSDKYKQGTTKQGYKPPAESRKGNAQRKAIKIDLDVWSDSDA